MLVTCCYMRNKAEDTMVEFEKQASPIYEEEHFTNILISFPGICKTNLEIVKISELLVDQSLMVS